MTAEEKLLDKTKLAFGLLTFGLAGTGIYWIWSSDWRLFATNFALAVAAYVYSECVERTIKNKQT